MANVVVFLAGNRPYVGCLGRLAVQSKLGNAKQRQLLFPLGLAGLDGCREGLFDVQQTACLSGKLHLVPDGPNQFAKSLRHPLCGTDLLVLGDIQYTADQRLQAVFL
jgi:hypothetical protein